MGKTWRRETKATVEWAQKLYQKEPPSVECTEGGDHS